MTEEEFKEILDAEETDSLAYPERHRSDAEIYTC